MSSYDSFKENFKAKQRSKTYAVVELIIRTIDVIRFMVVSITISAVIDCIWSYFTDESYKSFGNLAFRGYSAALIYNYGCPLVGKFFTFFIQTIALSGLIVSYHANIDEYSIETLFMILQSMGLVGAQLFAKFMALNIIEKRLVGVCRCFNYEAGFSLVARGAEIAHHFHGCSRLEMNNAFSIEQVSHDACSSVCYQADYSLFSVRPTAASACYCMNWDDTAFDGGMDCKVLCKEGSTRYCGTNKTGAVYSVCDKLSWGYGCQQSCMCESEFCDLVEGKCNSGGCMPGFRGERCDWWDETLLKSLWSLAIRSYLKEALELGIISKTGEYLNPIEKNCSSGFYGRACTLRCRCSQQARCNKATGLCPPGGCQPGWVGRRCDREAPCDPPKCLNGATCTIRTPTTYSCECPQTFVGSHCEYKNPCLSNPCHNRGTCTNIGFFFKCSCTQKFSGEHCQIVVQKSWSVNISTQRLGCFRNLLNVAMNLDLRTLINHEFMDKDQCVAFCRGRDYSYAGIEAGSVCYCANNFIFNQFGAVWLEECNSTCAGHSPASVTECGGNGLVTIYTACPINKWGSNCEEICMCAVGQCDYQTGVCRMPYECQFGWSGTKCNQASETMGIDPSAMLSVCLVLVVIYLPAIAFYFLKYLSSVEYEKLVKIAELEFDVDYKLNKARKEKKELKEIESDEEDVAFEDD